MKIWKALGLAGLAGVAATGVLIARDQRQRSELSPAEIKDRLHERLGVEDDDGHLANERDNPQDHQFAARPAAARSRARRLWRTVSRSCGGLQPDAP